MIAKTRHLKAIIFPFAFGLSAYYSGYLFAQMGVGWWSKTVWVLTALVIQVCQVFFRVEWENARWRKRAKHRYLYLYLAITASSMVASVAFGLSEIERQVSSRASQEARIAAIDEQLAMSDHRPMEGVEKQIQALQERMAEGSTAWTAIALNKQIQALRASQGATGDEIRARSDLRLKRAEIVAQMGSVRSLFVFLGEFTGGEKWARIGFVVFGLGVIEIALFFTADQLRNPIREFGPVRKKKRLSRLDKERAAGQLEMR